MWIWCEHFEIFANIYTKNLEDFWPKFSIIWPKVAKNLKVFLNLSKNLKFCHKIGRKLNQNLKTFRKFYQKRRKLDQKLAKIWNFYKIWPKNDEVDEHPLYLLLLFYYTLLQTFFGLSQGWRRLLFTVYWFYWFFLLIYLLLILWPKIIKKPVKICCTRQNWFWTWTV